MKNYYLILAIVAALIFSCAKEEKRQWKRSEVKERQEILQRTNQDTTVPEDIEVVED